MYYIPAILAASEKELRSQCEKILPHFSHISVDIVDGILFPNTTVTVEQTISIIKQYEEKLQKKMTIHFDFMVQDYQKNLETIRNSPITIGTVVVNTKSNITQDYISSFQQTFTLGISIPIETNIDTIKYIYNLNILPIIQIMSIEAGFQGNSFALLSLIKIEQLRLNHYKNKIVLDGGINPTTLSLIKSKQYKPDIVTVGSYFTKAEDITKSMGYFSSQEILPFTGNSSSF